MLGIMSPKHVYALVLRTCDYMTSQGKKDFADGIKLRIMRWESHPGHPGGPRVTVRVLGEGQIRKEVGTGAQECRRPLGAGEGPAQ